MEIFRSFHHNQWQQKQNCGWGLHRGGPTMTFMSMPRQHFQLEDPRKYMNYWLEFNCGYHKNLLSSYGHCRDLDSSDCFHCNVGSSSSNLLIRLPCPKTWALLFYMAVKFRWSLWFCSCFNWNKPVTGWERTQGWRCN